VIPLLRKILAKYKKEFPPGEEDWIFRGEKFLRPLDLDNLSRREIPQYINDKDIQSILRHADVSTTQAFYILPNRERAEAGLKKLDKTLRTKYGIKA